MHQPTQLSGYSSEQVKLLLSLLFLLDTAIDPGFAVLSYTDCAIHWIVVVISGRVPRDLRLKLLPITSFIRLRFTGRNRPGRRAIREWGGRRRVTEGTTRATQICS